MLKDMLMLFGKKEMIKVIKKYNTKKNKKN